MERRGTTCETHKRHQKVELQFTTGQTRQEDEFGDGLSPGKTDIAAVLNYKGNSARGIHQIPTCRPLRTDRKYLGM